LMLLGGFIWRNDLRCHGGDSETLARARLVVNFPPLAIPRFPFLLLFVGQVLHRNISVGGYLEQT
jgi:hypothetical protein